MDDVVESNRPFTYFQPNDCRFPGGETRLNRLIRQCPARSRIFPVDILFLRLLCLRLELLFRTETPECVSGLNQAERVFLIYGETLRLSIGSVRTANIRPFVPIDSKPTKVLVNGFFVFGFRALLVRVF